MPVGISRLRSSTAVKEPKIRVRPSVLMAGGSDDEDVLVAVRAAMPARLAPGGFRADSGWRRRVSRSFVLLFRGITPDVDVVRP